MAEKHQKARGLTRLSDIRRELAAVYRDARTGRIDSQEATRLTYVLRTLGELVEAQELERRIELLEATDEEESA